MIRYIIDSKPPYVCEGWTQHWRMSADLACFIVGRVLYCVCDCCNMTVWLCRPRTMSCWLAELVHVNQEAGEAGNGLVTWKCFKAVRSCQVKHRNGRALQCSVSGAASSWLFMSANGWCHVTEGNLQTVFHNNMAAELTLFLITALTGIQKVCWLYSLLHIKMCLSWWTEKLLSVCQPASEPHFSWLVSKKGSW